MLHKIAASFVQLFDDRNKLARSVGRYIQILNVSSQNEVDAAYATLVERQVRAVLVAGRDDDVIE